MSEFILEFLKSERGATAIEYGLIAALVSIASIGTLTTLGSSLDAIFGIADSALTAAATP